MIDVYTWVSCKVLNVINIEIMYGLLTKLLVKIAGYCPFVVCLWTKTESRSINS